MALDAAIEQLLAEARERPAPDPESLTIDERRNQFRAELVALGRDPAPMTLVEERSIDLVDRRLGARLYVPRDERAGAVILFAHGGSFVAGDLDSHDWLCRRLASDLRTRLLALDYRRAPEHPFPAAVEDLVDTILYLQAHRGDVGRSDDRVIVMGDSAGANLATVACRIVRDDADLAGQVLLYPTLGPELVTDSAHRFATGYLLEIDQLARDYERYLAGSSPTDWRVSPLLCGDLAGVAPAIIVVAECDPLRDEAVAYAGLLEHFGVPVELLEAEGMVHGFIRFGAVVPNALAIIDHLAEHVARFVGGPA
jgi:acetyl esterase/lipase